MNTTPTELVIAVILKEVQKQQYICLEKTGANTGNVGFVLPEGPVTAGEMLHQLAAKIVKTQTGVEVVVSRLCGSVYSERPNETPQRRYIYVVSATRGDIIISEKFIPEWHNTPSIPYDRMEKSYEAWLPTVLAGWGVDARFEYDIDGVIKNRSVNKRYL